MTHLWLLAGHFTSLSLLFLICKMGNNLHFQGDWDTWLINGTGYSVEVLSYHLGSSLFFCTSTLKDRRDDSLEHPRGYLRVFFSLTPECVCFVHLHNHFKLRLLFINLMPKAESVQILSPCLWKKQISSPLNTHLLGPLTCPLYLNYCPPFSILSCLSDCALCREGLVTYSAFCSVVYFDSAIGCPFLHLWHV